MLPYQNLSLEDMPGEVWKEIPDYNGVYLVSNLGRVKSSARIVASSIGTNCPYKERILKPLAAKGWYISVMLCKSGKAKRFDVHRLVAMAFVDNPDGKPCVDHIDADRWNNVSTNLRWVTQKENCNNPNSFQNYSRAHSGEKSTFFNKRYHARIIISIDIHGKTEIFDCIKFVEKSGFSYPAVLHCLHGHQNFHKGRRWMYFEDYISHSSN